MIYLTTGTNGAGKTLLTLKDVRAQQLKEARPVYFRGFTPGQQLLDWGWQPFEAEKWQDLPDGSICVFDEAQECFPVRGRGEPPQWIADIAKHRRKRGFDFWVITPHPSHIDIFVRRLVEKPSWHRHLKRAFGADLVSELKYGYVELQCEKPGSGTNAEVRMVPYPKEVYGWYQSASLHTAKRKIPKAVLVGLVAFPLALGLGAYAIKWVSGIGERTETRITKKEPGANSGSPGAAPGPAAAAARAADVSAPMTVAQFIAARTPRIPGLPQTAPAYDQATAPQIAPYPAACVESKKAGCTCYSQQGTRLPTPADLCAQIVRNGFFVDWHQAEAGGARQLAPGGAAAPAAAAAAPQVAASSTRPPGTDLKAPDLLSAQGDTAPRFFPAVNRGQESATFIGTATVQEARDAAVLQSMRDGKWHAR